MKEALEKIMQELRSSTEIPEASDGDSTPEQGGGQPQGKWDYYVETD